MWSWLESITMSCWKPMRKYARMSKDDYSSSSSSSKSKSSKSKSRSSGYIIADDDDGSGGGDSNGIQDSLLWSRELDRHSFGDFSIAVVQANEVIEDHSQVEIGKEATFVGVYDGHGGPDASTFIRDHLFLHFVRFTRKDGTISEDTLRSAFAATEDDFLTLVRRSCGIKPLIAAVGSCCLVGVIWRGTLYIANLGDSRAVIGSLGRFKKIIAEQLTTEHNAGIEEVRQELRSLHPDDSQIVVLKNGAWRVKGIIQVSRSIGDAYLKRPEFCLDPSFPRFHLPEPIRRPVLTAEPSMHTRVLRPSDRFVIFASDGLWEHLTNQEAAEIVHYNPRPGIASLLLRTALNKAARKWNMKLDDLKKVEKGSRRTFHDDITVVVIFIDSDSPGEKIPVPELSVRGSIDTVGPSDFSYFQGIDANAES
ncbi:PP2C domain-containing protein [Cephalotus follicularis]|uniref:protein-serine/threonine phosphatase n=1 Tax=Cephalotus follicularis TaxID=3775 RepID=A0A1Q3B7E5_CEPFO|nr:PP2C domain-containing protein [Cephalotus follicularis]